MRLVLVLALIPALALGQEEGSSVLLIPDDEEAAVRVDEAALRLQDGTSAIAPAGLYLNSIAAIKVAQHIKGLEAENASFKASLDTVQAGVPPLIAGALILLGIAAGAVAARVLFK